MASMEELVERFIAYKIRGLNIQPTNKSPFSEEVAKYIDNFLTENCFKLINSLLSFGDYTFFNIKSKEAFLFIQIYNYFAFILDDYLENSPKDSEVFVKYFTERECPINTPIERILQFYFRESKQLVSEDFLRVFNDSVIEWLKFFPQKQNYKYGEQTFTDEEFIKMRIMDANISNQLLIYTLDSGLRVTDQIKQNSDYIGLNEEIGKNAVMVNDLFSFVKEAQNGQGQFNYVYVKIRNNNLTIEQAMDQIVVEIHESERMAHIYANKLIASENKGLANYGKKLENNPGHLYWSSTCSRYNNPELKFHTNN